MEPAEKLTCPPAGGEGDESVEQDKEISGSIIKSLHHYVTAHKGQAAANDLLKGLAYFAGKPYSEKMLLDPHAWFSNDLLHEIIERLKKLFNDDAIVYKEQLEEIQQRGWGALEVLMSIFIPSPGLFYDRLADILKKFNRISIVNVRREGNNKAVVEYRLIDKYNPPYSEWCYAINGALVSSPVPFGFDPAEVFESECSVPLDRKGCLNGKYYQINDKKEVLEFYKGEKAETAKGRVIGTLAPDGTFKLGETVYGARNCLFHVTWKDKGLWARTIGQLFSRERLLRRAVNRLEEEYGLLEQKYAEIDRLNASLEEKVKERTRELVKSNKLKDLFIAIMQHDIKNYLTSIIGYSSLLGASEPEQVENNYKVIRRNAEKIKELISTARTFSLLHDPELIKKLEIIDLGRALGMVVSDLLPKAEPKQIDLYLDVPSDRYFFEGLPQTADIFMNLIDNAIKYGQPGTKVMIYVEELPSKVVLCVRNIGTAIPDKFKRLIFDRFERLDSAKKEGIEGSGLGLAIVKELVAHHNGQVWVEDNPQGGAIFKVELPRYPR